MGPILGGLFFVLGQLLDFSYSPVTVVIYRSRFRCWLRPFLREQVWLDSFLSGNGFFVALRSRVF